MAASLLGWDAGAAIFPATNPAQAAFTSGTNFPWMSLNFDQTTAEKVYFFGVVPQVYAAGTINAQIFWTATTTGDVVWGIKYLQRIDDDILDAALSAQVTVTDGVTAANDIMKGVVVLTAPTIVAGAFLIVELSRVAADAADTLAADAKFLGMEFQE